MALLSAMGTWHDALPTFATLLTAELWRLPASPADTQPGGPSEASADSIHPEFENPKGVDLSRIVVKLWYEDAPLTGVAWCPGGECSWAAFVAGASPRAMRPDECQETTWFHRPGRLLLGSASGACCSSHSAL